MVSNYLVTNLETNSFDSQNFGS